eukprot:TRINITY_DN3724_c0_g1_i1.p1 TRINITY_DN3724_c0_g1~~TRINITY_DN3724_c0_g1_i1.p1  ORF type:complete len:152 (-),score=32.56 TRINITY_DN3724_c0_g1_i1:181-636(-)
MDNTALLAERQQRIAFYENFISERLQKDLDLVLQDRENFYESISKYLELKSTLTAIKDGGSKKMKSMINLGSEFYVQAKVEDTSKVFVNVGLGFHVEFTIDEALSFIDVKVDSLEKYAEQRTQKAADIKSKIKLMYQGISELLNLPEEQQS